MTRQVKACKKCDVAVEANAVPKDGTAKTSLPIEKCPLCGNTLELDDASNYEI